MSASVSGMPGGQPSTTQPIAGPWLSPKVVTRKRCPKVLNDMGWCLAPCGTPRACPGQMAGRQDVRLGVPGDAVRPENIDHALIDRLVHGLLGRCDAQERDQGAPGATMGADDRVARERRVPGPDPQRHLP